MIFIVALSCLVIGYACGFNSMKRKAIKLVQHVK